MRAVAAKNEVMGRAFGGGTIEVGVEFQDCRAFCVGFPFTQVIK